MVIAAIEREGKMVVAPAAESNSSDDEIMRQRVRENLKYLEELGISRDFLQFAKIEYKLWVDDDDEAKLRYYRKSSSTNQNAGRGYTGRIVSDKQRAAAIERAEKLQRDLESHHHSFVKPMVRSHVSGGFWLGLPRSFCADNLPSTELRMTLEDAKGKEHNVLYLGRKNGLSGGWRGFAIDHNLEDGDAIVFELSQPARFKVHIVKAIEEESRESEEVTDGGTATGKNEKSKLKKDNEKSKLKKDVTAAAAKTEKTKLKKKDQPVSQKRPGSPKKRGRPAKHTRL